MTGVVLDTERLQLRELTSADAAFVFELVNDPAWIRFIGDKNVRSLDDARAYIESSPRAMYARYGFGLWAAVRKEDGVPLGLCGLIKRDTLEHVDLGFAFLPPYRSAGYAYEAAVASLAFAKNVVAERRIVAITTIDNEKSMSLLRRLGFTLEGNIRLGTSDEQINLFSRDL